MVAPDKQFWHNLLWGVLAFITLIALVCNTVFPIVNGEPAYAVFNMVVCALSGVFVYKKIKESGGV